MRPRRTEPFPSGTSPGSNAHVDPTRSALPTEVLAVLDWWRPAVRALLGDALVGARLTGSAVLGGFEPKWSDLDLCVVLRDPVTNDQAASLCRRFVPRGGRALALSGGCRRSAPSTAPTLIPGAFSV